MQNSTENKQPSVLVVTLNIVNTVTHLLLGAVAFGAIYFANMFTHFSAFRQHIYLCVIGYVILMAQAVLAMNPYNSWSNMLTQQNKRIIHWVMQVLGSLLAIAGSIIALTDNDNVRLFRTPHGILGIIAMILTILSLIGGVVNIFSSKLRLNANLVSVCHTCLGSLVLIIAFLSLCFGFHRIYRNVMGSSNANLNISLTVFALIGTLISALMRVLDRNRKE